MTKFLTVLLGLFILTIASCTSEEDPVLPMFSYTLDGETISDDNYTESFSTIPDIFQISFQKDGHSLIIQLNDYDGIGVYDPFVLRYQFEQGPAYYAQNDKTVEITSTDGDILVGTFSGIVEKTFSTETKTLANGTFRVNITN